jgi:hypothetical protein
MNDGAVVGPGVLLGPRTSRAPPKVLYGPHPAITGSMELILVVHKGRQVVYLRPGVWCSGAVPGGRAVYAAALVSLRAAQDPWISSVPRPGMVDYTLYTTREGRAKGESADAYHLRARGVSAQATLRSRSSRPLVPSYGAAILDTAL